MGYYKTGEKIGYTYSNGSLKRRTDINESVKIIRKKQMKKRLKERSS
jgi:hypothetical protein